MDEVKVVRHAVDRAVHVHGRNDDAVASSRSRKRNGVNIGGTGLCPPANQRSTPLDIRCIAQAEVFVTDSLAARQQAVGELLRRQASRSAPRSRTTPSSCAPRSAA